MQSLLQQAEAVAQEFHMSDQAVSRCVDQFLVESAQNLAQDPDKGLMMIPTYITAIPTGKEKGMFLAVDLGGTNFRVCSVTLHGDSTYSMVQAKHAVPQSYMVGKSQPFFDFLAGKVEEFLKQHHGDHFEEHCGRASGEPRLKMGFTFSFPVNQTAINRGTLIRWTKGYDIKDAVGTDVVQQLQTELDKRNLPVVVSALVNDTVGTLMARAYTKGSDSQTLVGAIFGTGTNGAYSEKIKNIPKFKFDESADSSVDSSLSADSADSADTSVSTTDSVSTTATSVVQPKVMVINTEWGGFDDDLKTLPNNRYDQMLDANSPNSGYHMMEKRVSGMYLGELLRLVLHEHQSWLLQGATLGSPQLLESPWSVDTSLTATIDGDTTQDLSEAAKVLQEMLDITGTTVAQRQAIQLICKAIGRRSAYMAAVPIAGLILRTEALDKFDKIDVGSDGSVVQKYPGFNEMMHDALRATAVGEASSRVHFGFAQDGSGVGAALCALVS